jgi:antitoxin (DNA-binding transcriptional repressor) of toxin-antitoxin stability system
VTTKEVVMEHIGVREFRDKASHYLHLGKPLAIERHGEIVGYYIPVKKRNPEEVRRRLARLEEAIAQVLAETGMSEDELAEAFDLSKRSSSQAG